MPTLLYTDESPPLNSDCRWLCLSILILRLLERSCSGHDVVLDLYEALCSGQLHCMIRTGPTGERKLLTPDDWVALEMAWWDDGNGNWRADILIRETGAYFGASFYVWEPDADVLWPCRLAIVSAPTKQLKSTPRAQSKSKQKPPPKPPKPPKWIILVDPEIEAEVRQNGRFSELGMVRDLVMSKLEFWKKKKRKIASVPRDRTIERGIRRHRSHWVED